MSALLWTTKDGMRHGVPGVLKNALEWVVGSGELIDKPIALGRLPAADGLTMKRG